MNVRRVALLAALGVTLAAPGAPANARSTADQVTVASAILDPEFKLPAASDLAPYDAAGTARVSGRFNLALNGTDSRLEYGGRTVYLLPAVPWSYVWAFTYARAVSQEGMRVIPFAPWTKKYLRTAMTDRHGTFTFENVPAGKYVLGSYVSTRVYTAHTYQTDDPEQKMEEVQSPEDQNGNWTYDREWVTEHHYSVQSETTTCDVSAVLESVVTVKPGDATTDVPVQIAGSYFEGACNKKMAPR